MRHECRQYGIADWHCVTCPDRPTFHGVAAAIEHEENAR